MNLKKIVVILIALFLLLIIFSIETCAAETTIHVYSGQSIQNAINSANVSGGDTIIVHSGTYSGAITIDKQLILTGDGNPTISASEDHTIEVTANGVEISGFNIENSGGSFSGVLLSSVTDCKISNNDISNAGNGIYVVTSDSNIIDNNNLQDSNNGIYFYSSDDNNVYSNTFEDNNANGIYLDSNSDGNTIYLNDFNDYEDGLGSNAHDYGSNNWDYNSQGNYWDDYNDYDNDDNEIGDNPYSIEGTGGGQDNFPLGDFLSLSEEPVAVIDSVSPNPATEGETVYFNGHGTPSGEIIAWEWKANSVVLSTTSEDYSTSSLSAGTYTIYYRVRNTEGTWSNYATRTLTINAPSNQKPVAIIQKPDSDLTVIFGTEVEFQGQGTDDGQITEYSWRSSIDGELSSSRYFTKSDLPVGQHTIYFKVRDNDGQWSSEVSTTVTILSDPANPNNPPEADAGGPYSGYVNQSITFDGSGSSDPDDGDSITNYQWEFGDGGTGTGVSPNHTYTSEGNYMVELTVTDSNGAQSEITTTVSISIPTNGQNGDNGDDDDDGGIPGFETIFVLIALAFVVLYIRKKRK